MLATIRFASSASSFFALCHQRANLLAGHIALIAQRIRFGCRRAAVRPIRLPRPPKPVFHPGISFLMFSLTNSGLVPDQANVDHVINPPSKQKGISPPFSWDENSALPPKLPNKNARPLAGTIQGTGPRLLTGRSESGPDSLAAGLTPTADSLTNCADLYFPQMRLI